MSLEDFIKIYKPIPKNPDGGTFFNKYIRETPQDVKDMKEYPLGNIWSILDISTNYDEWDYNIKPGLWAGLFQEISQLGWIITEVPWEDENLTVGI